MAPGTAYAKSHSWWQYFRQDLQPAPGRLQSSLRIALTSIIVLTVMMVLQMPFAAYGLYVVFMVGRINPVATLRTGIALVCAVECALSLAMMVVILTDNDPMARVLGLAAVTFVAGMVTVATSMPGIGSGWGLIFCVGIGFWENHASADSLVKSSLWLLAAFATGIAIAVGVEYVFGTRSPAEKLAEQLQIRYSALETMFKAFADDHSAPQRRGVAERVSQLAAVGHLQMLELHAQIVDRNLDRGTLPVGVHAHITMLAELLDSAAAFGLQAQSVNAETHARCELVARRCGELARQLKTETPSEPAVAKSVGMSHLDRVESILGWIHSMPTGVAESRSNLVALPSKHVSFLIPGAIGKVENVAFSLKISLCATICYILYHAIAWPGISTSVITIMVAGLTHSGAMKQKLAFRLLGTIIGGLALGIGAEVFLFPFMDSITSLVVVIGAVAFCCAWVASGSRFGYFGIQMAFAFYLTTLEGFSAPRELATARDRLVGISLGVSVMWFVLDQIWPVRSITVMRETVVSVLRDAGRVVALIDSRLPPENYLEESNSLRDRLGKQLATLRGLNEATEFEFGVNHREHMDMGEKFMRISMTAVALVWNHAVLLHQEDEGDSFVHPSLVALRGAIVERLSSISNGLSPQGVLDEPEMVATQHLETPPHEHQSEYTRNLIARYDELNLLADSLRATV